MVLLAPCLSTPRSSNYWVIFLLKLLDAFNKNNAVNSHSVWRQKEHTSYQTQSVNTVWNAVMSEGKQRGAIEEERCGRQMRESLGAGEEEREEGQQSSVREGR